MLLNVDGFDYSIFFNSAHLEQLGTGNLYISLEFGIGTYRNGKVYQWVISHGLLGIACVMGSGRHLQDDAGRATRLF